MTRSSVCRLAQAVPVVLSEYLFRLVGRSRPTGLSSSSKGKEEGRSSNRRSNIFNVLGHCCGGILVSLSLSLSLALSLLPPFSLHILFHWPRGRQCARCVSLTCAAHVRKKRPASRYILLPTLASARPLLYCLSYTNQAKW